ncbi:MAG TPA: IPT/TIG domain-containing protein [Gemmatimonadaceae bacterium]
MPPTISSITPNSKPQGSGSFVLTCQGSGFIRKDFDNPLPDGGWTFIRVDGIIFDGTYYPVDPSTRTGTSCSATIPASEVATPGSYNVRVEMEDGEQSNAVTFTVTANLPVLTSVTPTSVTSPASATIVCNGSNFTASSVIRVDGVAIGTTFVSSTQLQSSSAYSFSGPGGTHAVTVFISGVGESEGRTITKNNPLPTISAFSPNVKTCGDADFTLTITGTGYNADTRAAWNGSYRDTVVVSATQLQVSIRQTDLASAGSPVIGVINPAPGGGTARNDQAPNIVAFTINNPAPIITEISPTTATAGTGPVTISVRGSRFVGGTGKTVIRWNGVDQPTTVIDNGGFECTFVATQAMLAQPGSFTIAAFNGSPAGGLSNSKTFNVTGGVPVLNSIDPSSVPVASSTTITLRGSGFAPDHTVRLEGVVVASDWDSTSRIQVNLTPAMIPTPGTYDVKVTNNGANGGTSATRSFQAANGVPVLTSINVTTKTVGDAAFTLTLTGSGFINGASSGAVNGAARATTFVSSTSLQIIITAADLSTGGTLSITVVTAAPGGGTSAARTLTINYPVPTVSSFDSANIVIGSPDTTVAINGTGFGTGTLVKIGAATLATTFVNSTRVTAVVPAANLTAIATLSLSVVNPTPGGGTAACPPLNVVNPTPAITSLSPTNVNAGSGAFTLTINGTGFRSGVSSAFLNGSARTTTFMSATQLQMAVNANDVTASGTLSITVVNTGPGGGTSAPAPFFVGAVNPVPTVSSMSPSNRNAGEVAPLITITGTNFLPSSVVRWEGGDRVTTYVSATQLKAQLLQSDMAVAGTYIVQVFNPPPGGGLSGSQGFVVNAVNQPPEITGLSPASAATGGAQFTLTINGLHFLATTTVKLTDAIGQVYNPTVTFVNSTKITVLVPNTALINAGNVIVAVTNPTPGGGTVSSVLKVQTGNPVPSIINVSPSTVVVGAADTTITITGAGFYAGSVVRANGTNLTTTFVNSSTLTATMTAALAATVGILSITVFNTTPGGGTSNAVAFAVLSPTNPIPEIDSLSPDQVVRGIAQFLLTILGRNFIPTSSAAINGTAKTTTYVSPTRVDATIPAADVALAPGGIARVNPRAHSETVSHNAQAVRAFAAGSVEAPAMTIGPNETKTGWHSPEEGVWEFVSNTKPQVRIGPSGTVGEAADFTNLTAAEFITRNTITALLGFFERGRGFGLGEWVNEPYHASKFTGDSDATWNLGGGADMIDYSYMMIGETMWVSVDVRDSTITTNAPVELYVSIPLGLKSARTQYGVGYWRDSTTPAGTKHLLHLETAGTAIIIRKEDGGAWPTTTTGLNVGFVFMFAVELEAPILSVGPSISSITPASVTVGSAEFTLQIVGHNFSQAATCILTDANAANYTPTVTWVTSQRLTIQVPPAAVLTEGTVTVAITNPAPIEADDPAGGTATKNLTVEPQL